MLPHGILFATYMYLFKGATGESARWVIRWRKEKEHVIKWMTACNVSLIWSEIGSLLRPENEASMRIFTASLNWETTECLIGSSC